ncbi:HAD family hydrolase [Deefgea piscis]|uniref:phosphoglycolate phosphatase n=1 Tax=Deefgea piscis TaxID=2739061 RepID=A0A6M8SNC4_9NEIS|nr:HAD family hydrolase [Deefgea piscis]QKJ66181.1 HAD family hydrolase [Deefgea piscis]
MYASHDRLILLDADGTIIDAFSAIETAFSLHGMQIGDLERFQKRRNLFKYLGGLKEFPRNLAKSLGNSNRKELIATLTDIYREQAMLYPSIAPLLRQLLATPGIKVGLVTRNVTHEPAITLARLFARHDLDIQQLDFFSCIALKTPKNVYFSTALSQLGINPARAFACGDEHKDYLAMQAAGVNPFMVSYGFEDLQRLTLKYAVPEVIISRTPVELGARIRHAFDLPDSHLN